MQWQDIDPPAEFVMCELVDVEAIVEIVAIEAELDDDEALPLAPNFCTLDKPIETGSNPV